MTDREKLERLVEQKQRALKVQRGFQESVYCDRCRCCWDEDVFEVHNCVPFGEPRLEPQE